MWWRGRMDPHTALTVSSVSVTTHASKFKTEAEIQESARPASLFFID